MSSDKRKKVQISNSYRWAAPDLRASYSIHTGNSYRICWRGISVPCENRTKRSSKLTEEFDSIQEWVKSVTSSPFDSLSISVYSYDRGRSVHLTTRQPENKSDVWLDTPYDEREVCNKTLGETSVDLSLSLKSESDDRNNLVGLKRTYRLNGPKSQEWIDKAIDIILSNWTGGLF